jgi:dihydroneopterin aldolase
LAARRVDAARLTRKRTNVDKIFLRELKVETIIGFWEWERRIKQIVIIDLEIASDARTAANSEKVAGTLNYEVLAKRLVEYVGGSQHQMVEALATAIGRIVISEFGAPWVKVSVAKPGAIPTAREVGVVIERTSADYA